MKNFIKEKENIYLIVISLIVLLGTLLRFYFLDYKSITDDELAILWKAQKSFYLYIKESFSQHLLLSSDIVQLPFVYLIYHFIFTLGKDDFIIRLPSVLFGVFTIPIFYLLGKNMFNKRVGLYCAFLLSISTFHIHFSQEARHYSLFLLFASLSFLFFYRLIQNNLKINKILYIATTVSMMFSNIFWIHVVMAQIISFFIYYIFILAKIGKKVQRDINMLFKNFLFCWIICFMCYLPCVPMHYKGILYYTNTFEQGGGWKLSWEKIKYCLDDILMHYYDGTIRYNLYYYLGIILGCGICFYKRKFKELFLLLILMGMPVFVVWFLGYKSISSRHFIIILLPILLFIAVFADFLVAIFMRLFFKKNEFILNILFGILLIYPIFGLVNYYSLPRYYWKTSSNPGNYKELARYLTKNITKNDFLVFADVCNIKRSVDWYLCDELKKASLFSNRHNNKIWLVDYLRSDIEKEELVKRNNLTYVTTIDGRFNIFTGRIIKMVPIMILPNEERIWYYKDTYDSLKILSDFHKASNIGLLIYPGRLAVIDPSIPGFIEYKFAAIDNNVIEKALIEISVDFNAPTTVISYSYAKLLVSRDSIKYDLAGTFYLVEGINSNHYRRNADDFKKQFDISNIVRGSKELYLKVELVCGEATHVTIKDIEVNIVMNSKIDTRVNMPLYQLESIHANTSMQKWEGGIITRGENILYVFSCDDMRNCTKVDSFWNTEEDLRSFEEAYSDIKPIKILYYFDNKPAFKIYDPYSICFLKNKINNLKIISEKAQKPKGLLINGYINNPILVFGDKYVSIPIDIPTKSQIFINTIGDGTIRISPLYNNLDYDPKEIYVKNIFLSSKEDCITNNDKGNGELIYKINSLYQIKKFSLITYPRIFNDNDKNNYIKAFYSVDGTRYNKVYSFKSNGQGLWGGVRLFHEKKLPRGTQKLFIKFILSCNGVQLWSDISNTMIIEAVIDMPFLFKGFILKPGVNEVMLISNMKKNKFINIDFIMEKN